MKLTLALTGITLALCSLAPAQDDGSDRIVIPARNSTRPRKLDINLVQGSVTVKAHTGKETIVETKASTRRTPARSAPPAGMHRIDLPARGVNIEEDDNQITIRSTHGAGGEMIVTVPTDTSVTIRTTSGNIAVEGVNGEFDLQTHSGQVTLTHVSGSVVAHSMNGPMKVEMDRVDTTKPLSLSTFNGSIDVTMPAAWKANLKLNTNHGEIWTDFDFKLGGGGAITQPNNTSDGKFRVAVDRTISGSINGGGPEASFHTFNGKITIHKK